MQLPPVGGPGMYGVNPMGGDPRVDIINNLNIIKAAAKNLIDNPSKFMDEMPLMFVAVTMISSKASCLFPDRVRIPAESLSSDLRQKIYAIENPADKKELEKIESMCIDFINFLQS